MDILKIFDGVKDAIVIVAKIKDELGKAQSVVDAAKAECDKRVAEATAILQSLQDAHQKAIDAVHVADGAARNQLTNFIPGLNK